MAQKYGDFHERIIATLWGSGNGYLLGYGYVHGIGPIWFLLALFWCKLFFSWLYNHTKFYLLSSFIISIVSLLLGGNVSGFPMGMLLGSSALVFYAAGVFWKQHIELFEEKKVLIVCLGIPLWIVSILFSELELSSFVCSLYPITIFGAISATYIVYRICCYIPTWLSPFLSWLGQNTLKIVCYHTLTCLVFNRIIPTSFTESLSPLMYFFWYTFLAIGATFVQNFCVQFVKALTKDETFNHNN